MNIIHKKYKVQFWNQFEWNSDGNPHYMRKEIFSLSSNRVQYSYWLNCKRIKILQMKGVTIWPTGLFVTHCKWLWDLRFSWQLVLGVWSSGLRHHVVMQVVTSVSEEPIASIITQKTTIQMWVLLKHWAANQSYPSSLFV